MTNRTIKEELKKIYQPPVPQQKNTFLKRVYKMSVSVASTEITTPQFLLSQLRYIRPWGWIVSISVFIIALFMIDSLENEAGWAISALIPFVSVSLIAELHRSVHFKMDELEQSSRFSLKAVVFARLCILGLSNLFLLSVLAPFMIGLCQISAIDAVVYLLCPYTMTSFLCLLILRYWHSNENILACAGISIIVSLFFFLSDHLKELTIGPIYYLSITLVLLALMLLEYKKYFTDLEAFTWS